MAFLFQEINMVLHTTILRGKWFIIAKAEHSPDIKKSLKCGVPRTKEQKKTRMVLECRNRKKTDPYRPSLHHVVTIKGFQVLLSSITCLPSFPTGRRYLPYSSPHQYMCLIQSANDLQDPFRAPCTLSIKMD